MTELHFPRPRVGIALLVAGLLVVTGCGAEAAGRETPTTTASATAEPAATEPAPTEPAPTTATPTLADEPSPTGGVLAPPAARPVWSYHEQRPVSQFVKVDGALVGYTLRHKRLRMTALDPTDGSVIWDRAASPGFVPPGVPPYLTSLGKNVVLLEPTDSDRNGHFWTTVAMIDAQSGVPVARSDLSYWVDGLPERCGRRICFDGYSSAAHADHDDHRQFVMNPATGRVRALGDQTSGDQITGGHDWRSIGEAGLVHVENEDGDAIGRVVDGELSWQRRLDEVFGEDHSPNAGWDFSYDKENGLYTGEVGWYPGTEKPIRENLRKHAVMVGLDAETGQLRWREKGVSRACGPVQDAIALIADGEDYRCRYRSGFRDPETGAAHVLEKVGISIQRFDPTTGKTSWEVDTDTYTADDWEGWSRQVAVWDDHSLLATQDDHRVVIDIETGAVVRVDSDEVGWGATSGPVSYAIAYYSRDDPGERVTASLIEPRSGSGAATKSTRFPPKALSADFGTLRVITGTRAVTGVRLR